MSGEGGMVSCDFGAQGSSMLSSAASGSFLFPCVTPGSHYFSSSSGTSCEDGLRVHIQVTQPAKTANLRATFNNVTGRNHTSLANIMIDIIKADRKDGFDSNAEADALLQKLWCVVPHSPQSCSDYFPESYNSVRQQANSPTAFLTALTFRTECQVHGMANDGYRLRAQETANTGVR